MQRKLIFAISLLFLSVFFTGCVKIPYIVGVKGEGFRESKDTIIRTKVLVDIKNDNFYSIKIKEMTCDFSIANTPFGKTQIPSNTVLKKKSITQIEISPEIYFHSLALIPDSIFNKDVLDMQFHLISKITFLRIKYEKKFSIGIRWKEMLNSFMNNSSLSSVMKISKVRIAGVNLYNSQIDIDISLKNIFPTNVLIDSLKMNIYPDSNKNMIIGKWDNETPIVLEPKKNSDLTASFNIDNRNTFKSALQKIFTGSFTYYMEGIIYFTVMKKKYNVTVKKILDIGI